jgi:hypothetical protein
MLSQLSNFEVSHWPGHSHLTISLQFTKRKRKAEMSSLQYAAITSSGFSSFSLGWKYPYHNQSSVYKKKNTS